MTEYSFFVPGVPRPQSRPRLSRTGHVYNPKSAEAWKTAVMSAFLIRQNFKVTPITGAVSLSVSFYLAKPKTKMRCPHHLCKPDLDNLLKSTMDALTKAGAWEDDCQVCMITAHKDYALSTGAKIIIIGE
jgi:Holliday junction resolvase RusA-like endonuclease